MVTQLHFKKGQGAHFDYWHWHDAQTVRQVTVIGEENRHLHANYLIVERAADFPE